MSTHKNTPDLAANIRFVAACLEKGDRKTAAQQLASLRTAAPHHPEILRLSGIAEQQAGRFDAALAYYKGALSMQPERAVLHNNLGSVLRAMGRIDEALDALRRATELDPNLAAAWYHLGKTCKTIGDPRAALEPLQIAVRLSPGHVAAGIMLGDVCKALGRLADAEAAYRRVISLSPGQATAWWALSNLKTVRFGAEDVAAMRAALAGQRGEQKIRLLFALYKGLEDTGEFDSAFTCLRQANALKRESLPWDAADFSRRVDETVRLCRSALRPESMPVPEKGQGVIFITGLPRSGSTLLQQMLASHPAIEAADELVDLPRILAPFFMPAGGSVPDVAGWDSAQWRALGETYWRHTVRWRPSTCRWFIDKLPNNWQWCEAIVRMLPQAVVIDSRREMRATLFGNYSQLFAQGQAFTYSLEDLTAYWRDYLSVMDNAARDYPGRVRRVEHEALVAGPEVVLRPLLAWLGVEWDERCLRYYENDRPVRTASAGQVRQPLHKPASARWEAYFRHLPAAWQPVVELGGDFSPAVNRE